MKNKPFFAALAALIAAATAFVPLGRGSAGSGAVTGALSLTPSVAQADYRFADFQGRPPVHIYRAATAKPQGMTPAAIKKAYNLPSTGGSGTIAIIDAYDDATMEADLAVFDKMYGLADCTTKNGCFEKHKMASSTAANSGWAIEESLDVEWAHAIAPKAKILLVEAKTPSGANLLSAIDYAAKQKGVVAVSMSWGGAEFSDEATLDSHFASASTTNATSSKSSNIVFFASSGDDGTGASWPAASPYVVGVGGTTLTLSTSTGKFVSEKAWSGSGGGVSAYETEPAYQTAYNIAQAKNMRAIPDVAYNADPATGYPVYKAPAKSSSKNGWYTVGGTSAGAPQWAAIQALGLSVALPKLYSDKASSGTLQYFRDITSGANGTCKYYCDARKRYDYVTGLGAPQTVKF
jgi:subtilase family serine protease